MKTPMRLLVLACASTFLALTAGCSTAASIPPGTVVKSKWLVALQDNLTEGLCSNDEFFRSCYPISEDECAQRARALATSCEKHYMPMMPRYLTDEEMETWGGMIGECAGTSLSKNLDASFTMNESSESCQKAIAENM